MSQTTASKRSYQPVIGIEVHVQLATETKMFCGCRVKYGAPANSLTCPVCLGLPGALPAVNRRAIEYAIRVGLALNCKIARWTRFDRKNYFYPDLPKGYQISQFDHPLCYDGELELPLMDASGLPRRARVIRAHVEEDAGKSVHMDTFSLVDLNRAGTPLVEIVGAPDLHSPDDAYAYLTTLKRNLSYLGVSPLSMEKGSLRCDINVSLRPAGSDALPDYKVEIKNLNSFSNARAALIHEIARQSILLDRDERPAFETRLWDDAAGTTRAMRSKEEANDYRFFPEPDLPPLAVDERWVEEIRAKLPEMPDARLARFIEEYRIKRSDADALVDAREMGDFFEACVTLGGDPRTVANWMSGEVSRAMNERKLTFGELRLAPAQLTGLLRLLETGRLNNITAKEVFAEMLSAGGEPEEAARRLNKLIDAGDDGAIDAAIDEVVREFEKAVGDFRAGKGNALGFLVGQCMRKLKGKGNPKDLGTRLERRLAGE